MIGWFQNLLETDREEVLLPPVDENNQKSATKEDLDNLLSSSFSQLSVQERERKLEALHGINCNENPEDPATLDILLEKLDCHLQGIKLGTVYEVAESMNRSFVTNRKFRLMFLRADRYDSHAAADRIIRFLDVKKALFGIGKLTENITLEDLSEDDMKCLESGSVQANRTDIKGRALFLGLPHLARDMPVESDVRVRFYIAMAALESEEVQHKGVISLWYAVGADRKLGNNTGLLWDLPLFRAGIHICCYTIKEYISCHAALYRLPPKQRPSVRIHYGSHSECIHVLSSFGIPQTALPLNTFGEPNAEFHSIWIQKRREIEKARATNPSKIPLSETSTGETNCSPLDVTFGKGRGIQNQLGNVKFRNLLLQRRIAYDNADRQLKQDIAAAVVREIKAGGGRFLKQSADGCLQEVTDHEARVKVTNAFRSQRKVFKRKSRNIE
jgi:hypothetical protein